MDFDAQYGQDSADGQTFDHGYYSYDGYDDDGAGGYNGIDDFDLEQQHLQNGVPINKASWDKLEVNPEEIVQKNLHL